MTDIKTLQALVQLAKQAGATVYQNRHFPGEPAVSFGNESWARFCALIAQMQREPDAYERERYANGYDAGYEQARRDMQREAVQPVAWAILQEKTDEPALIDHEKALAFSKEKLLPTYEYITAGWTPSNLPRLVPLYAAPQPA